MARRPQQRIQRSDRVPVWFGSRLSATSAAGAGSTLLSQLNAIALALRPFTIIRTRLVIHVESDQAAVSELLQGVYGRIVVEEEAATAGVASVPKPLAESDAPWLVYQPLINSFLFLSSIGVQEPTGTNIVIDSKAMWKVGLSETLISVIELSGAFGAIVAVEGRTLVKLH